MINPNNNGITQAIPLQDGKGALVGYARVSTTGQDLSSQLDALQAASCKLQAAGCQKIFHDVASGAKSERPGLEQALAFLRAYDTLVVWKIDRLGRSLPHLIQTVQDLHARDVRFLSLTDAGIDTTTPGGTLVFRIFAALADFERELVRERTKAALAAARARGRKGGRRTVITPETVEKAHSLIEKKGMTVREAALPLKIGKTSLYKALATKSLTLSTN